MEREPLKQPQWLTTLILSSTKTLESNRTQRSARQRRAADFEAKPTPDEIV